MANHSAPGGRILVVEDEDSISAPFAEALRRAGFEALVTRTAAGALELAGEAEPDLVMLDLTLPDGDGRDVCRELRRRSDVPIVMLTARGTEMDKIVGLELGADDYVVKPFSAREVISRIRAVLRRSAPRDGAGADEKPIRIGELELDSAARVARLGGEQLDLSRKEFDLLAELMRNAGRVVKREDLMSNVWDVNWFGSTKTLDVHIGWLRRKLGDEANRSRYIETVRGSASASPRRRSRNRKPPSRPPAGACLRSVAGAHRPRRAPGGEPARPGRFRGARSGPQPGRRGGRVLLRAPPSRPATGSPAPRPRLGRQRARSVIVVDGRGRLIADSAGAPSGRSYASRPEIRAALRGRAEQITRNSQTLGADILATAVPVLEHGRPHGAVRVTQSVAAVSRAVKTSILDLRRWPVWCCCWR